MADNETKKKPRSKRRNYQRELADLRQFCEISIEIMEGFAAATGASFSDKIAAYREILAKIGESK